MLTGDELEEATVQTKIKWGVIGSGGIARRRTIPEGILPASNAELVAVYDLDPNANAEVARQFKARAVSSVSELLCAPVEAVYVATPPACHDEQVVACAQAGKHILCEKPLGLTVDEAEKMIAACQEAGVILGAGFMMRFHTQHQAALKLIQAGRLGKLVFGRVQLSCWYPPMVGAWRQDPATGGGGSLMDMGGHCIDLLEMFFGPSKQVSCLLNRTVHSYQSEDSAVVTLMFESGALAVADNFYCIPDQGSLNVLELYGSRGSILAKHTIGQGDRGEMVAFLEEHGAGYSAQQIRDLGQGMPIQPAPYNTYRAEIEEFSQALLERRQPADHAQLGLQSQKVLAACYESARRGKVIQID
jgi:predicted dehydrogenase